MENNEKDKTDDASVTSSNSTREPAVEPMINDMVTILRKLATTQVQKEKQNDEEDLIKTLKQISQLKTLKVSKSQGRGRNRLLEIGATNAGRAKKAGDKTRKKAKARKQKKHLNNICWFQE